MQIKTTLDFNFPQSDWLRAREWIPNTGEDVKKGECSSSAGENANSCNHYGKQWKTLKKLKIILPYHLVIPLLGIYLKDPLYSRDTCLSMFVAAFFTLAKKCK